MRTFANKMMGLMTFGMAAAMAMAGEASTSATATSGRRGPGTAAATADYDGNGVGLTRTKADSGRINFARGLSLGFDEDGLSLSTSYALAGRVGPAVGGTFNVHVGLDGKTSTSVGTVVAKGGAARGATVEGLAGADRGRSVAASTASGNTLGGGKVDAWTHSEDTGRRDAYYSAPRPVTARGGRVAHYAAPRTRLESDRRAAPAGSVRRISTARPVTSRGW